MITIKDIGIYRLVTQVTINGITITAVYIPKLDLEVQAVLGASLSRSLSPIGRRLKKTLGYPKTIKYRTLKIKNMTG